MGEPPRPVINRAWFPSLINLMLFKVYRKLSWFRDLVGAPTKVNGVVALDPLTGQELWWWVEKEYNHWAATMDEEGIMRRYEYHIDGELICLPDPQGIPLIGGDGTVYFSSSHFGDLV